VSEAGRGAAHGAGKRSPPRSSRAAVDPGPTPPRVSRLRLGGPAAEHARARRLRAPLGAVYESAETHDARGGRDARDSPDAGEPAAHAVALGPESAGDVAAIIRALPPVSEVGAGSLVVVLGSVVEPPTLANRVLGALGRGRTLPRALRCSALVARGYVDVGAGTCPVTGADLAWGYAPAALPGPAGPTARRGSG